MTAVKVIKVIGTSENSWEDAAHTAYQRANETLDDVHGLKVDSWTAEVADGDIIEYKATVELAFPVRESPGQSTQ